MMMIERTNLVIQNSNPSSQEFNNFHKILIVFELNSKKNDGRFIFIQQSNFFFFFFCHEIPPSILTPESLFKKRNNFLKISADSWVTKLFIPFFLFPAIFSQFSNYSCCYTFVPRLSSWWAFFFSFCKRVSFHAWSCFFFIFLKKKKRGRSVATSTGRLFRKRI